ASKEVRLGHLKAFREMVETGGRDGLPELIREIQPGDPAEQRLIALLPDCLDWLASVREQDRREIQTVLREIIRGQTLDLQRFPAVPGDLRTETIALATAAELEEYTYLVAGCVGAFWTRICAGHLPRYSGMDLEELSRIGIRFGQGLQLVNILRDLPSDLRSGRCYLPLDELSREGASPGGLLENPRSGERTYAHWWDIAAEKLDSGSTYIGAIRPARVRIGCYLPWYLGIRTLQRLKQTPPLEHAVKIKVPRSTVYRSFAWAPFVAFSNTALDLSRPAPLRA
ncbi:MAG: phytoene/squalene synthase family protein, partial [Chthoniobacteraceae bacterium]